MKKHCACIVVLTLLCCLISCREHNPQDPSFDHSMDGVAKSVKDGREKAKKWAGEGQRDHMADSISVDSLELNSEPLKDSLKRTD